ncbi:hypothetical protein BDP55DRAFT_709606 [Colletotrichum godetiae]|uniref:Ubiquitin-like domain-containing protein n=1 Tax=Colletotrichum godetiae TaxID=1209918 RepID=A0AAJ0F5B2_9PEZI|nr:uncharacterized protein BDP55DRAFT_709606 [Colletotrichum godetiae]KAK1701268.1 hypothetical protein BDP55DRAFT_709606 [Colletotrichum godetiae]
MKPSTRIPLRLFTATASSPLASSARRSCALGARAISTTPLKPAEVAPVVGTGPPPEPPIADIAAEDRAAAARIRVERRRKQAEMLKHAKRIRTSAEAKSSKPGALKRRFWNDVSVQEVDGALQVHLDSRPLRHPNTKEIIRLPPSKQHLASALAIEWDFITSAEQATKQHLIPLTSLICRAIDIAADDAANDGKIRETVTTMLMRYLDTDAVLCWAPPAGATDTRNDAGESLRDVQKRTADAVVGAMTGRVWPGIEIKPVLDGHSIVPQRQAEGVREVVQGWVMGLDAWELTGLERAVLAGKSLLGAARLVVEWSEGPVGECRDRNAGKEVGKFGVEEAATALSLEVTWQTGSWGEVEDTHDVEKEDLRRQLGSVVLLVSGTNRRHLVPKDQGCFVEVVIGTKVGMDKSLQSPDTREDQSPRPGLIAKMSFGWSAGDIVAALQLLNKVRIALKDSGGSKIDYQDATTFLDQALTTLQMLRTLDGIQTTSPHPELLQGVSNHVEHLQKEIGQFLEAMRKDYGESLSPSSTSSKATALARKIQYALSASKKVQCLRAKIGPELSTLQIKLMNYILLICAKLPSDFQRQMEHTMKAQLQSYNPNQEIKNILQLFESRVNKLDGYHEQVMRIPPILEIIQTQSEVQDEHLRQLASWSKSLPNTKDTTIENRLDLELLSSILQHSQQVATGLGAISDTDQTQMPTIISDGQMISKDRSYGFKKINFVVIRSPLQSGIKLIDALGRKSTLPYECGRSWDDSNKTIQVWFRGCPGENLVANGFYCVADSRTPSGFFAQESWSCCVKDGMTIQMSVITNTCTDCGSEMVCDDLNEYALCSSCNKRQIAVTRDAFLRASSNIFSFGGNDASERQIQDRNVVKTTSLSPQHSIHKQLKHAVFYAPPSYGSYQITDDAGPFYFGEIDTGAGRNCKRLEMAEETLREFSQCYGCYLIELEKELVHVPYLRKNWGCPEPFLTNGFQHWSEFGY